MNIARARGLAEALTERAWPSTSWAESCQDQETTMIEIVGFTGSQQGMTGDQAASVSHLLHDFKGKEFHHGGCVGADVQAAELARIAGYVTIRHPGDTPAKQDDRFVDNDYRAVLPNLTRNKVIVDEVELMIAAPGQFREILRSGTWSTIRYARKTGKQIYVVTPDGMVA